MKFIQGIKDLIARVPIDTLWHMFVGTLLGLVGNVLFTQPWMVLSFVALFAIGKEAYDFFSKEGTPEISDGFATFLMGFLAYWLANISLPII